MILRLASVLTQILFIIKAFVIVSIMSGKTPVKLKALKSLFKSIMFRLFTVFATRFYFISLMRDSVSLFQSEVLV